MGYTTEFEGEFLIHPRLPLPMVAYLRRFNDTRRMARRLGPEFGVEGEFYVFSPDPSGQDRMDNVIDYNRPPKTQPGLWCGWTVDETGDHLIWDGMEKFYHYVEWLEYLIRNFFEPFERTLSGRVTFQGEAESDHGTIVIENNGVRIE